MAYITKIGNSYYAQLAVPASARAVLGTSLFRRSLKTGDRRQAEKLAGPIIAVWQHRIDQARGAPPNPVLADAVAALRELGYEVAEPRARTLAQEMVAAFARFAASLEAKAATMDAAAAERSLVAAGVPPAAAAAAGAVAAEPRQRRAAEAASIAGRLDGVTPPTKAIGETMKTALARWEREAKPARASLYDAGLAVRVWCELHGDMALSKITRQHVAAFREMILVYPRHIRADDRKLSISELIAKYRDDESRHPDPATAGKKLNLLKAIMNTSKAAGVIDANPFESITIQINKRKVARLPFEPEEVRRLFATLDDQPEHIRWVVRLGLVTGARLAELSQLRAADVQTSDGVTFIRITDQDDEHGTRDVKTAGSVRRVPIRAELAGALVAFAEGREGLMFPEFVSTSKTATNVVSKKVMPWVRAVVADKRKTFHSFRHLFIDLCRDAGIQEEVRNALTGHAGGDHVGRRYGNGVPLTILADAVARLKFPVPL